MAELVILSVQDDCLRFQADLKTNNSLWKFRMWLHVWKTYKNWKMFAYEIFILHMKSDCFHIILWNI